MSRTEKARYCRIGRNLWKNHREIFESRRKFGEELFRQEHRYNEYLIDIEGATCKSNKNIVKKQLATGWKKSMDDGRERIQELASEIPMPDDLKPNERKIFKAVINGGFVGKDGILKHPNGKPISKQWIGKLSEIENVKTLERAIRGLIDKGILIKEKKNLYRVAVKLW